MSKIARKPIAIPEGIKFSMNANMIDIEGPMGKLSFTKHENISIDQEEGSILVKTNDEEQVALSGTTRALLFNMVHGVSKGWIKKLKINSYSELGCVQKSLWKFY